MCSFQCVKMISSSLDICACAVWFVSQDNGDWFVPPCVVVFVSDFVVSFHRTMMYCSILVCRMVSSNIVVLFHRTLSYCLIANCCIVSSQNIVSFNNSLPYGFIEFCLVVWSNVILFHRRLSYRFNALCRIFSSHFVLFHGNLSYCLSAFDVFFLCTWSYCLIIFIWCCIVSSYFMELGLCILPYSFTALCRIVSAHFVILFRRGLSYCLIALVVSFYDTLCN